MMPPATPPTPEGHRRDSNLLQGIKHISYDEDDLQRPLPLSRRSTTITCEDFQALMRDLEIEGDKETGYAPEIPRSSIVMRMSSVGTWCSMTEDCDAVSPATLIQCPANCCMCDRSHEDPHSSFECKMTPNDVVSGDFQDSQPKKQQLQQRSPVGESTNEREYIDNAVRDVDVISGQGGRSNNHSGNRAYLAIVAKNRMRHGSTCSSYEKKAIAKDVIDQIRNRGGRFLKEDRNTGRWYVLSNKKTMDKVSQALREKNVTPIARALKRAKYQDRTE